MAFSRFVLNSLVAAVVSVTYSPFAIFQLDSTRGPRSRVARAAQRLLEGPRRNHESTLDDAGPGPGRAGDCRRMYDGFFLPPEFPRPGGRRYAATRAERRAAAAGRCRVHHLDSNDERSQ